jgi:hypothetical protein
LLDKLIAQNSCVDSQSSLRYILNVLPEVRQLT